MIIISSFLRRGYSKLRIVADVKCFEVFVYALWQRVSLFSLLGSHVRVLKRL